MNVGSVRAGEPKLGFLFDGVDDQTLAPTALFRVSEKGRLEIDVLSLDERSWLEGCELPKWVGQSRRWTASSGSSVPATLVLETAEGSITLVGVYFRGFSGGAGVKTIQLGVRAALLERPAAVVREYEVLEFSSTIEGLDQFCSFPIFQFTEQPWVKDQVRAPIEILPERKDSWESAGFEFQLVGTTKSEGQASRRFELESRVELRTLSEQGAGISEHYAAQRKIRALLVLAFGHRMPWWSHTIKAKQFFTRFPNRSEVSLDSVPVLLEHTQAEHREPKLTFHDLAFPVLKLADIGPDGLRMWCDLYEGDDFRRAVESGVEAIATEGAFVEPTIMMLVIALDRFAFFAKGQRRAALPVQLRNRLDAARIDWPEVGSNNALAWFLANVNNALKHPDRAHEPDRGGYPSATALYAARGLAEVVARAQLLPFLDVSDETFEAFLKGPAVTRAKERFTLNGLKVDEDGLVSGRTVVGLSGSRNAPS